MSTAKFNQWLNPDGTENYKCRAWVNFNGTGTVAILASGNVSSITDNGTGDYTLNFTNAMADSNYSVVSAAGGSASNSSYLCIKDNSTLSATSCRLGSNATNGASTVDQTICCVAIFR